MKPDIHTLKPCSLITLPSVGMPLALGIKIGKNPNLKCCHYA